MTTYTIQLTEKERVVLINCLLKCKTIADLHVSIYKDDKKKKEHYQSDVRYILNLFEKLHNTPAEPNPCCDYTPKHPTPSAKLADN